MECPKHYAESLTEGTECIRCRVAALEAENAKLDETNGILIATGIKALEYQERLEAALLRICEGSCTRIGWTGGLKNCIERTDDKDSWCSNCIAGDVLEQSQQEQT